MKRLGIPVLAILLVIPPTYAAQSNCVESSQHYEGSPKPNVYVVAVFNNCRESRHVQVTIYKATTMKVVKKEEFPLEVKGTRYIRYSFEGEELLSYSIVHSPQ